MSAEAMDFYWEHFLNRVVKTAGKRIPETFRSVTIRRRGTGPAKRLPMIELADTVQYAAHPQFPWQR